MFGRADASESKPRFSMSGIFCGKYAEFLRKMSGKPAEFCANINGKIGDER